MEALCWLDARQKDVAGGDAVFITAGCRNLPECDPRTEGSLQESLLLTAGGQQWQFTEQ